VDNPDKRRKALDIQGGNRGFGDEISTLLVVTQDTSIFRDAKERNQAYVDGGLFSMSLLYALHYLKMGCCPLNWSASRQKDMRLRSLLSLAPSEVIIMLIAAGEIPSDLRVAYSPRRSTHEVVTWIS
jgi:nitroreductase